ncbi:DUF397 domain-containing protein [Streptomyces olivaceus]|uniref:DUF397 domain-containing protein n=1 Tax=Streptomyces olivaceus TaxID=47716 RepID=UPI0004C5DC51|nr:DUF397 domain-containing protein [Streptomyces olivaceus]MBZ6100881.1 DUF397 domain-containing protein [Streptomyces olivaceus]
MTSEPTSRGLNPLSWFKSSYSGSGGGDCVEVAAASATVHVRDSKDRALPSISVGATQWAAFVGFAADRATEL